MLSSVRNLMVRLPDIQSSCWFTWKEAYCMWHIQEMACRSTASDYKFNPRVHVTNAILFLPLHTSVLLKPPTGSIPCHIPTSCRHECLLFRVFSFTSRRTLLIVFSQVNLRKSVLGSSSPFLKVWRRFIEQLSLQPLSIIVMVWFRIKPSNLSHSSDRTQALHRGLPPRKIHAADQSLSVSAPTSGWE